MKPACMDQAEWAAWQDADARLLSGHADSPCRDCTPLFHADMVAGGMCDGTPLPEQPPGKGGRPMLSPPLADWAPARDGRPRYGSEEERAAGRRESTRRAHRRMRERRAAA